MFCKLYLKPGRGWQDFGDTGLLLRPHPVTMCDLQQTKVTSSCLRTRLNRVSIWAFCLPSSNSFKSLERLRQPAVLICWVSVASLFYHWARQRALPSDIVIKSDIEFQLNMSTVLFIAFLSHWTGYKHSFAIYTLEEILVYIEEIHFDTTVFPYTNTENNGVYAEKGTHNKL